MPETPAMFSHGDVVPRVRQLLAQARQIWREPVTQRQLVQATHLDPKTISAMVNQHTKRYDERTLGLLCWYFGCDDPGDILARLAPPGHSFPALPEVRIGRIRPPAEAPPDSDTRLVRIALPAKLAGTRIDDIVKATGLARNTVVALLQEEKPVQRIARRTLATLYDYLDQQEGQVTCVGEVLVYIGPRPWSEAATP